MDGNTVDKGGNPEFSSAGRKTLLSYVLPSCRRNHTLNVQYLINRELKSRQSVLMVLCMRDTRWNYCFGLFWWENALMPQDTGVRATYINSDATVSSFDYRTEDKQSRLIVLEKNQVMMPKPPTKATRLLLLLL